MSSTISEASSVVTLIDVFSVNESRQGELVGILERNTVEVTQYLPGFLSVSIHRGLDGRHVANYSRWASRADFEAAQAHPKMQECARAASLLGRSLPALYTVDSTFTK